MTHHTGEATIAVDISPAFMPHDPAIHGSGELAVPGGDEIIDPTNRLLAVAHEMGDLILTTQDWHPRETGHFSEDPDFRTSWPVHSVAGTPGAEIDPRVIVPADHVRCIKGMENLQPGQEDTSYSGYNAINPLSDTPLPEILKDRRVERVNVFGLAADYCVGMTALDLAVKGGYLVTVVSDATRAVSPISAAEMDQKLSAANVRYVTSDQWIEERRVRAGVR